MSTIGSAFDRPARIGFEVLATMVSLLCPCCWLSWLWHWFRFRFRRRRRFIFLDFLR